ncbi:MAG: ABC transporter permease subunit, partial [Rubrobacter sp.]|nr:ABC transporter permease subunit [Rubrobacter sp.]
MNTQAGLGRNALRVALKESKESLYAVRGSVWAVISAIVLSLMSYLLLTDAELSLLDQSEMLYIVASLTVGLGLLVSSILAGDSVAGERERGTLEGLLLTPIGRGPLVLGKIGAVLAAWLLVFAISAPYIL